MPLIDWKPSKLRSTKSDIKCPISPANLQTDLISANFKNGCTTLADLKGFTNLENLPSPQNGLGSPSTSASSESNSPPPPPPLPPRNRGRRCRAGATPPTPRTDKQFSASAKAQATAEAYPVSGPIQLVFHCQFAHGGPTGLISGFHTVKELYSKIAQCYDITDDEILFCTLNTHKLDMERLLGGQLGLDDFIFVHLKGQRKEVEIAKCDSALGLTITDNGAGKAFVKRIKPGSLVSTIQPAVKVGDFIEKLNGVCMVGKRHMTVAKALRDVDPGSTFTLRLVEPLQGGFSFIAPRSTNGRRGGGAGNGKQTLRFKATGPAVVVQAPDNLLLDRLNHVLDTYMGISDKELAIRVWELGRDVENPLEFSGVMSSCELAEFQIPEEVVFDMWGVINDWRRGRLQPLALDDQAPVTAGQQPPSNANSDASDAASILSCSADSSNDSQ